MDKKKDADKRQKQHDEILKDVVDDFDKFEDFVSSNLKNIMISFAVLAVVVTVSAVVYSQYKSSQRKIASELTATDTVDKLKKLVSEHKGSASVYQAKLKMASILYKDGKYDEALAIFAELAASAPEGEIRNLAILNEAYTLESLKRYKDAAAKFAAAGQNLSLPEYIRNEANFSAARIYLASLKEPDKAKLCLKSVDFSKDGFWSGQAEMLLHRID